MSQPLNLKSGTLQELQEYIAQKIKDRGFEDESVHERLLLLTEEVGELIKACRKVSGMNIDAERNNYGKVGEEVADVINLVFAVAIKMGIDVEKEFLAKEKIIDERVYKRSKENT